MAAATSPNRGKAAPSKAQNSRANGAPFSKEEELAAFRNMLLIRRFEEKAGQMYGMGLIGGFCHLYIGQEAVVTGVLMAAGEGGQTIAGHRVPRHFPAFWLAPRGS